MNNTKVNLAELAANKLTRTAFVIGYAKTFNESCRLSDEFYSKTGCCCSGKQLTTFDGSNLSVAGYVLFV